MHVLVTGATGQLGRPLCAALRDAGHAVTALGRDPARLAALTGSAPGLRALAADLRDDCALDAALSDPAHPPADAVIHLAGGVRGPGALTADALNRDGTERLIAALRRAPALQARPPRVIFASSCAVYGDRNGLWLTESYAPAPHTAYGASKLAAEQALLASGLPAVIARIAAVYGPGMRMMLVDQMRRGRALLPGEGQNFLPLIHLDDAVAALIRLLDAGQPGQIYHLAGRSTPQLREFYRAVHARAGGRPVRFWSTWIPGALQRRAADLNERAQARLGLRPRLTNDQLKLWTAGVRLKTERLEKELGFVWRYPDHAAGIEASVEAGAPA